MSHVATEYRKLVARHKGFELKTYRKNGWAIISATGERYPLGPAQTAIREKLVKAEKWMQTRSRSAGLVEQRDGRAVGIRKGSLKRTEEIRERLARLNTEDKRRLAIDLIAELAETDPDFARARKVIGV